MNLFELAVQDGTVGDLLNKTMPNPDLSQMPITCLSIRQPWAWMILHGGKDIENRTWPTSFRGRVLIHTGLTMTGNDFADAMEFAEDAADREFDNLHASDLERGGIVGSVEIVACLAHSDSPWFVGPWGFVLRNPQPLPFIPCKGALGFFRIATHKATTEINP